MSVELHVGLSRQEIPFCSPATEHNTTKNTADEGTEAGAFLSFSPSVDSALSSHNYHVQMRGSNMNYVSETG